MPRTPSAIPMRAATLGCHPLLRRYSEPGLHATVMMKAMITGPMMELAARIPARTATAPAIVRKNLLSDEKPRTGADVIGLLSSAGISDLHASAQNAG